MHFVHTKYELADFLKVSFGSLDVEFINWGISVYLRITLGIINRETWFMMTTLNLIIKDEQTIVEFSSFCLV